MKDNSNAHLSEEVQQIQPTRHQQPQTKLILVAGSDNSGVKNFTMSNQTMGRTREGNNPNTSNLPPSWAYDKHTKPVGITSIPNTTSRHIDENALGYSIAKVSRRRSRSNVGENEVRRVTNDDDVMATNAVDDESEAKRKTPQHKTESKEEENSEYSSCPPRDVDFEVTLLSERNRRVLFSRLAEVAPRGRLSMINFCRRGVSIAEALLIKEALIRNPQLSVLKLSYNNLGDEGAAIIASAMTNGSRHHRLSVLDMGFNSIGDVGCGMLALHGLAGNHNLRTLYLSGNQIGEKGALSIAGAILHGSSLQCLYLSANKIGPLGMKTIAGAIAKNEAKLISSGDITRRSIEVLHFASASLESSGFVAIPGMLLSNTSLKALCVSENNLGDQDIMLLSQAFTQNKSVPLETLHLSFNQITCIGVECLMNALWGSKTLQDLKLDNNKIQDRGAQLCAVALTSIPLKGLDLSFNNVSTVGIKALMKNLSENNSIQTLGLSGIPIDQNSSKAVSYALAYNSSLRALHLDNCSTGYASQRHIVAGAVSNRKSSLRVLTGFLLSPIAMTLGMPRLPQDWSNDQVLGFFRLMWEQWLLKSRYGSNQGDDSFRGPAPPAAVAAAAKIAFSCLGTMPSLQLFRTEQHEKPVTELAPVEPAESALLERTNSGTIRVPLFTVSSEIGLCDFVDNESKAAAAHNNISSTQIATVRAPLENPQRRSRNLQWLRLNFRALSDISRLPFNNADLWQLHQYYFSPPIHPILEDAKFEAEGTDNNLNGSHLGISASSQAVSIPQQSTTSTVNRTVSFHSLNTATTASASNELFYGTKSHKRPPQTDPGEYGEHAPKRVKNFKPRIAYYPRLMAKIQSLGTRPTPETLALLRKLKYAESVIFGDKDPYSGQIEASTDTPCHADIDMILLDLL